MDSQIIASHRLRQLIGNAERAAALMKVLSHPGRLLIVCHLVESEMSVGQLGRLLGWRQSAVSQQLARLREEGIVAPRRAGKSVVYSISDPRARRMAAMLDALY